MIRTTRASWYEIWTDNGNCRLAEPKSTYANIREAKKAIKESKEKQISLGYTPQKWAIMIVDNITTYENGMLISTTTTTARV